MPEIGNIAINDGESSPVTHTFSPINTNGGKALLENRNTSVAAGSESFTVDVRRIGGAETSNQIHLELILPTVATVEGVPQVVRSQKVKVSFYASKQGSSQDRKNARILLSNALVNAKIGEVIDNIEWLY